MVQDRDILVMVAADSQHLRPHLIAQELLVILRLEVAVDIYDPFDVQAEPLHMVVAFEHIHLHTNQLHMASQLYKPQAEYRPSPQTDLTPDVHR